MNVEEIPGVGPGLATIIRQTFRSDEAFLAAARAGNLQAIETVPGISPKRAVDLVRHVLGVESDDIAATPAAKRVLDATLTQLQSCAATTVGRNRLRLLGPCAATSEADARREHVLDWKAKVARLDRVAVHTQLRRIKPLADPRPRSGLDLLLVPEDRVAAKRLEAAGVEGWAMLGSLADAERHDGLVVWVRGDLGREPPLDIPEVDSDDDIATIIPSIAWAWRDHNAATLEACAKLAELVGTRSKAPEVLALTAPANQANVDVAAVANKILADLHGQLERRLAGRTWDAATVMKAMGGGAMPTDLAQELRDLCQEGRERLRAETGIDVAAFAATMPLSLDDEEIVRATEDVAVAGATERYQRLGAGAAAIGRARESLAAEVAYWLEFDADFALGSFALDHDLQDFRWGTGIAFAQGHHLDLPQGEAIAYDIQTAPVVLLTGANSGGKTTLLEHLAQIAMLARLGLPVPGHDATVDWYDSIHLVTASRSLDAGAFESFLRRLLPIVRGDTKRLVLADELEAITELESAARILAFLVKRMATMPGRTVIVSHMAPSVQAHLSGEARVDGIEARGLGHNDELLVCRTPVIGRHARSTPELIVQRMAAAAKGDDKQTILDLLAALRGNGK